ncbi:SDR family oxidoreductase [Nonomuraea salmonea]
MRVLVTGGTGHSGSYIVPELIAAGHAVTGLARSDTAAAALSALGAKARRGDLQDLDGLKEAAADSDGVIHVAHRQDLLPSGGIDAVAAAELPVMFAYGEALAGTGKPLVAAGSIGSPGQGFLGRAATEEDPALPGGDEHKGTLRARNVVETTVIGLAEQGVRSSVVRIANIMHSTTDRAGFLPTLIALAKEKGFVGYPGDGANLWNAVHVRDAASLFRLALEKGPAGRYWHAVEDGGHPVPRDRRGHRQPPGPARRERTHGRADASGILRVPREHSHAELPGVQPHHQPDSRLGTRPAQPARRLGQRPLFPGRLTAGTLSRTGSGK